MTSASTTNAHQYYSNMRNQDDHSLFNDEDIQRFEADAIKTRYGDNWKNFVSNVREIPQPDGSIVKEYIIDDPSVLENMKPASQQHEPTISDDDSTRNKFAQIKAKFEQKNAMHVMASPSTSSVNSGSTTSRQNTRKQIDDLYARHRRSSNESVPNNDTIESRSSSNRSVDSQNTYHRSQSVGSEQSKVVSYRQFDSVDEADEEVRRIHRQGEELRRHTQDSTPVSSLGEMQGQPRIQYEVVDEEGNPMAVDGIQDLIKMSGVRAREVPQPDGSIIKEYVIDDPQLVSRFRSQDQQPSPMTTYRQQPTVREDAPPPPPRVPLRQPMLFRQAGSSMNDNLPYNIQQIHVLEPQRRYEYLTTTGRRVQFMITNFESANGQPMSDAEVRELTNAINTRLLPSSTNPASQQQQQMQFYQQQQQQQQQMPYNPPKPWQPAMDIVQRPRLGSDTQSHAQNANMPFQQMQQNLPRSASYGALNQGSYYPQNQSNYREPVHNSNTLRYQHGSQQRANPHQQTHEPLQTAAQFLPNPQQMTNSSPLNGNQRPVYYQQAANYPFQGQQQHGVRLLTNNFAQQRTAGAADGHARI